jgi:hypothetical protein
MNDEDAPAISHKRKRDRSPSYPGIDLKEAIAKAEVLYREEGKHKAPVNVVLDHWGYQPRSGGGLVALAALKKFGLLEDEGTGDNRMAGLSASGLAIVMDEDADSSERQRLIKESALRPAIHAELWRDAEGKLPSDASLRTTLKMNRGFTESGAAEFIRQFRATIAYAGLSPDDKVEADEGLAPPPPPGGRLTPPPAGTIVQPERKQVQSVAVTIPVPEGAWPVLNAPLPMPEQDWKAMLAYLELMRPAFVKAAEPAAESTEAEGDAG